MEAVHGIRYYADIAMCILWVTVYTLVLISTYKNKIPFMPPIANAVIIPWEVVAVYWDIRNGTFSGYGILSHIGFGAANLTIICTVLFILCWYNNRKRVWYILGIAAASLVMAQIFRISGGMLFTSYSNTILGILLWIIYTAKKTDLPLSSFELMILVVKLIADSLAIIVYSSSGGAVLVMSLLLPILDMFHIFVFYIRVEKAKKRRKMKK